MEITKILSGMQNQVLAPASDSGLGAQAESLSNIAVSNQVQVQPALSSKYTYAVGNDGKRYVLQLRIDIARLGDINELA